MESKQQFGNWITNRIEQYGFVEGVDFTIDKIVIGRATQIDYYITLDMAKELSMVERNEKGKQAAEDVKMNKKSNTACNTRNIVYNHLHQTNKQTNRRFKMLISSQRYLDEDTVQAKRAQEDYIVTVSPEFEIDGIVMRAMIDGHHSLAAAKEDGVDPEFVVATEQDDDRIPLIDKSIDDYLTACYVDSDWYDVDTGRILF